MNRAIKYKSPGAKRLMVEASELKDHTEDYSAQPVDDNLFEWHFTIRGPPDTSFEEGYYHGRLLFPPDYPMKPPSIVILTPNGRFETNRKVCLSISGYHPETWQPSWSVRTALLALIAFMPSKSMGAIGSLEYEDTERKRLARNSRVWCCEKCGPIRNLLAEPILSSKPNAKNDGFKKSKSLGPNIGTHKSINDLSRNNKQQSENTLGSTHTNNKIFNNEFVNEDSGANKVTCLISRNSTDKNSSCNEDIPEKLSSTPLHNHSQNEHEASTIQLVNRNRSSIIFSFLVLLLVSLFLRRLIPTISASNTHGDN